MYWVDESDFKADTPEPVSSSPSLANLLRDSQFAIKLSQRLATMPELAVVPKETRVLKLRKGKRKLKARNKSKRLGAAAGHKDRKQDATAFAKGESQASSSLPSLPPSPPASVASCTPTTEVICCPRQKKANSQSSRKRKAHARRKRNQLLSRDDRVDSESSRDDIIGTPSTAAGAEPKTILKKLGSD